MLHLIGLALSRASECTVPFAMNLLSDAVVLTSSEIVID